MAGRGTDIILGGNSDYMARLKIKEILSPRLVNHDGNTIPPLPSEAPLSDTRGFQEKYTKYSPKASLYPCDLSLAIENSLRELAVTLAKSWGDNALTAIELDEKIADAAEKSPSSDADILLLRDAINSVRSEYDVVVKEEEKSVRSSGGLHVIGTERHESRRVDNQLRGRAGRQGDPGSTRFFLSLEDNLLRIFGGERVASLMNAFRVEDDMPIESALLTRSLEGAQKKVETYYYDIRKQFLNMMKS